MLPWKAFNSSPRACVCFYVFTRLFIETKGTLEVSKNPRNRKLNLRAPSKTRSATILSSSAWVRLIVHCNRSSLRHSSVDVLELASCCTRAHAALILWLGHSIASPMRLITVTKYWMPKIAHLCSNFRNWFILFKNL